MRPSAIIRSISRREAMPARASSLAMRCGPSSRPVARRGTVRRSLRLRRGTRCGFVRCGGIVMSSGVEMLFGKRKRIVKRILIVEDEPLTAFDNENMLGDAGYEIVATVDDFDEALSVLEREEVASDPQRRPPAQRADRHRSRPAAKSAGHPDPVRDRPAYPGAGGDRRRLPDEAVYRAPADKAIECVDRHLAGREGQGRPRAWSCSSSPSERGMSRH